MEKELAKCEKLEDKGLKVLFGGYYKKEENFRSQWDSAAKEHAKLKIEEEVFRVLESQENKSLKTRLMEAHQAVALQEAKENELQIKYSNLRAEKERLEKTLAVYRQ